MAVISVVLKFTVTAVSVLTERLIAMVIFPPATSSFTEAVGTAKLSAGVAKGAIVGENVRTALLSMRNAPVSGAGLGVPPLT